MFDRNLFELFKTEQTWKFKKSKRSRLGRIDESKGRIEVELVYKKGTPKDLPTFGDEMYAVIKPHYRLTLSNPFNISSTTSGIENRVKASYTSSLITLQFFSSKKYPDMLNNLIVNSPILNRWLAVDKTVFQYATKQLADTELTTINVDLDSMKLKLSVDAGINSDKYELNVYNSNNIRLDFSKPVSFWSARMKIKRIEDFLSLVGPVPHNEISFTNNEGGDIANGNFLVRQYLLPNQPKDNLIKNVRESELLFSYHDLNNISQVIKIWFTEYENLEPVIENLMFVKTQGLTEKSKFLTYVNSLEILHTKFFDEPKISENEYNDKKTRLLKSVADQDKEFIENALEYSKRLTLLTRLKKLRDFSVGVGCKRIENKELVKVVNTRNNMIHSSDYGFSEILHEYELHGLNVTLAHYLKSNLLRVISVNEADLRKIVKSSFQFQDFYRDGR